MVNHMAPFILSNLLLERLKENTPSRIVNVNAGLYVFGKLDLEKTPYGKDFSRLRTYMNTKLGNILFTCELAKRIEGSGVTVNALHPGVIRTNLGIAPGILGAVLSAAKLLFKPPEEGARAPVWLATAPELETVSGKYFDVKKETELTETAKDTELAEKLWNLSSKLAGMPASP
jgi:NAD(P)-dependent dehydrogenase (short-subunit alcohol dehydrogenase family)